MKPYINNRKCYVNPRICKAIKSCTQSAISYIEDKNEPLEGRIVFDCGDAIDLR